jgi:hypothetical protein
MVRLWLLIFLVFSASSSASSLIFCANCTSAATFNNQAIAASPNRVGTYEYYVMNPSTNVVYDIVVEVDEDVQVGGQHIRGIDSSTTSSDLDSAFAYWYPVFYPASSSGAVFTYQVPLTPPGLEGRDTFSHWTPDQVCTALSGSPQFVQWHNKENQGGLAEIAVNMFRQKIGHGPIANFVFQNGDVAQYYLYTNLPGVTGCGYVAGSARDALGQFINDAGNGGNGHTNGNEYVHPAASSYIIYMEEYYYSCAYITNADGSRTFLGCEIE